MPEGSSEDWEFQVVGKKKGKRFWSLFVP
jgi:PERQ amino acid-rich with GYF domain-containing protein